MANYTELIIGCSLSADTPIDVIRIIKSIVLGKNLPKGISLPLSIYGLDQRNPIRSTSSYFGVRTEHTMFVQDSSGQWMLSTRSSCTNGSNEIERFLSYIRPYIVKGSGAKDIYAMTIGEEDSNYKIYSLTQ